VITVKCPVTKAQKKNQAPWSHEMKRSNIYRGRKKLQSLGWCKKGSGSYWKLKLKNKEAGYSLYLKTKNEQTGNRKKTHILQLDKSE